MRTRSFIRDKVATGVAPLAILLTMLALSSVAHAQGRLTAQYKISVAGLTIGRGDFVVEISDDHYAAIGAGQATGFLRILVNGQGTVAARGAVSNGRLVAQNFSARLDEDGDHSTVAMTLDNGNVKELASESSAASDDRIPLTEVHQRSVIDPVSAMLIPGEALSPAACQRTLPIFDGRRRYDLKLSFKRIDKVKTDRGYDGAVLVCAIEFQPLAGHRAKSLLVKYLADGRDLELWLAPINGTDLLGPYRLSVANLIGSLTIDAVRYEYMRLPAAKAATAPPKSP